MAVYRDVEKPREEGESRTVGLEHGTWARPDEAEATRVSTKREVAKVSLVTEGVSRPLNSTNRTQKTI